MVNEVATAEWRLSQGLMSTWIGTPRASRLILAPGSDQQFLQSGSININEIEIDRFGRFGNALIQLGNTFALARSIGVKKVSVPRTLWLFADLPLPWYLGDISITESSADQSQEMGGEGCKLFGAMYNLAEFTHLIHQSDFDYFLDQVSMQLEPRLDRPLGTDCLVVHLRSGDIFTGSQVHRGYGQPPLAFYKKILESKSYKEVVLVYEDVRNPVIEALDSYCTERDIVCKHQSSSVMEDMKCLLRAQSLVLSRGTFALVACCLARNVSEAFVYGNVTPGVFGNMYSSLKRKSKTVDVHQIRDVTGEYDDAVLRNNWSNSAYQREIMLSYSASALEFDIGG